jgi:hypothetical protein
MKHFRRTRQRLYGTGSSLCIPRTLELVEYGRDRIERTHGAMFESENRRHCYCQEKYFYGKNFETIKMRRLIGS